MPRGRGRGGYRKPDNPSPTPMPGGMSNRTDGGPADKQPIRTPTGGKYGSATDLRRQQQAAPLAAASPPPNAAAGAPPTPAAAPPDVFAPTQRPGEPITAGVPIGEGPNGPIIPPDSAVQLRALYQAAVENNWPFQDQLRRAVERAETMRR